MPGGRPKAKYSQALRLLEIWEMLHHRSRVTIQDLADEFGVDRRTVHRDISALRERYALDDEWTETGEKTFFLKPTARLETLRLTLFEMMALYMGRNLFAFAKGTDLAGAMDSLYSKLRVRLCHRNVEVRERLPKKLYCTTGFPKAYDTSDDVLNDVLTGIINEEKVEIEYRTPAGKPFRFVLHPYTLVAHNHALYVVGHAEYAAERRTYALERILDSRRLRERFDFPEEYDPAAVFHGAFGITTGGRVQRVRLRFAARVAPYVEARQWHASMRTQRCADGGVEVVMDVAVSEELVHWVTGYGDAVQVLAPRMLRRQVRSRHRAALAAKPARLRGAA